PIPSSSLFTSLMRSGRSLTVFRPSSVRVLINTYVAMIRPSLVSGPPVSTVPGSLFMPRHWPPAGHGARQHSALPGCTRSNAQCGPYSNTLTRRTTRGGGREDLGHPALPRQSTFAMWGEECEAVGEEHIDNGCNPPSLIDLMYVISGQT